MIKIIKYLNFLILFYFCFAVLLLNAIYFSKKNLVLTFQRNARYILNTCSLLEYLFKIVIHT